MVAPLGKLNLFSFKDMIGHGEFFMSPKEKGPKLPQGTIMSRKKQNL
jgi:hypothetical protein